MISIDEKTIQVIIQILLAILMLSLIMKRPRVSHSVSNIKILIMQKDDVIFGKDYEMHIQSNPHYIKYESLENYLKKESDIQITQKDKEECIQSREIWTIRIYRENSDVFYSFAAPTFEKCFDKIKGVVLS